jgi:DNA primase
MSSIDEIKARIDIVDLASEAGVKLRRSGRTQTGFCPFHSNTHPGLCHLAGDGYLALFW